MTPDRERRPLPSSLSFAVSENPTTFQQWKTALQRIKVSYLRGQWKHCAARCNQLLLDARTPPHELHATCLHFFCALSNEAIARLAHPLSAAKLQLLQQAKQSYEAAASSLPAPTKIPDIDHDDDSWSEQLSSSSNESEILDYYQSSPCPSSPRNGASSPSSVESASFPQDIASMKPSPLRIRKSIPQLNSTPTKPQSIRQLPKSPPSRPFSPPTSQTQPSWLHTDSLTRYNDHLASFAKMLTHHISTVESLIQSTREAQAMRYFAKRLVSYGEDEAAKAADLKARIVKLKAAGWRRERFRPERYEELCARALEELY